MVFGYFVDTILYTAAVYAFLSGYEFGCYRATPQGAAYRAAYRVTGYPVTTLIFCAVCVLLICSCGSYALATRRASIFVLLSVLVAGMIVYWLTDIRSSARGKQN